MKLSSAVVTTPSVRYEIQHAIAVILFAFAGAFVGYLQAEPNTAIADAIMHWSTGKPMLIGALTAGVIATIGQAQKSFFKAATVAVIAAFCFLTVATACTPAARAPVENELTKIAVCVEDQLVNQHVSDVGTVIAACGSDIPVLVMDIIKAVLDSTKGKALPAPQLEGLKRSYAAHLEAT